VGPADADTVSCLAQPLLQQSARKVVFLVYHDVQSVLILQRLRHLRVTMQPAPSALMSARLRFVSVETLRTQAALAIIVES
jgi:hypothetical protein